MSKISSRLLIAGSQETSYLLKHHPRHIGGIITVGLPDGGPVQADMNAEISCLHLSHIHTDIFSGQNTQTEQKQKTASILTAAEKLVAGMRDGEFLVIQDDKGLNQAPALGFLLCYNEEMNMPTGRSKLARHDPAKAAVAALTALHEMCPWATLNGVSEHLHAYLDRDYKTVHGEIRHYMIGARELISFAQEKPVRNDWRSIQQDMNSDPVGKTMLESVGRFRMDYQRLLKKPGFRFAD